jgi:hypothetical protein
MAVKSYPQLDKNAVAVLRLQVRVLGSVAAVAHKLGYSRPAISGALNGTYTGGTAKLRTRIADVFGVTTICPHLNRPIPADECNWWRTRPCPTSRASDVRHWAACKTCPFNPDRKEPTL